MAKSSLFGCARVISTTRSEHKVATIKEMGVDDVIIDSGEVAEHVMKLTQGKGADKCIDLVGANVTTDNCMALSGNGTLCCIGAVSNVWAAKEFNFSSLAPAKKITMYGSDGLKISESPIQEIVDAVGRGEIVVKTDKVFKLEEAGEGHAYMEANKAAGKVVCVVE